MRIQELNSFKDIAEALDIKTGYLRRLLFDTQESLYKESKIPKKDGSFRKIYSPNKNLLTIQRRLLEILENSVQIHPRAYGFVKNKSTVDNARQHLNKKYLLNIDLENFFPSISAGRVHSLFSNYFKLNKTVASTLTNLCCHPEGFLPQGAPTSPMISNILCKTLDNDLNRLAKNSFGSSYTRYADDISFSSNRPFKDGIINEVDGVVELGSTLKGIISRNGFRINSDKIRLQKNYEHQEVTGIVVNSKLNIDRRYIRRIRAMLHSIETNIDDLSIPVKKLEESNHDGNTIERLFMIIKGMIDYVGMVRGKDDIIFGKLATRLNQLLEVIDISDVKPIFVANIFENSVCVIKNKTIVFFNNDKSNMETIDYGQGSGFLLKGHGIVSNYHVFEYLFELGYFKGLKPSSKEFYIETFFGEKSSQLIKVKIDKYCKEKDIILFVPEDTTLLEKGLEMRTGPLIKNEEIRLLGYPDFSEGDELKSQAGNYLRTVTNEKIKKYEISTMIYGGNSGGPVIDSDNKVIGIATEGRTIETNRAVPISYINSLEQFTF